MSESRVARIAPVIRVRFTALRKREEAKAMYVGSMSRPTEFAPALTAATDVEPYSHERVKDGIPREREHPNQPLGEFHGERRGMPGPGGGALDVPEGPKPALHLVFRQH